jgi:hypothetical protein
VHIPRELRAEFAYLFILHALAAKENPTSLAVLARDDFINRRKLML